MPVDLIVTIANEYAAKCTPFPRRTYKTCGFKGKKNGLHVNVYVIPCFLQITPSE